MFCMGKKTFKEIDEFCLKNFNQTEQKKCQFFNILCGEKDESA